MRSPQLARCSRDQLRRRMGQHGAALARGRCGGFEVFRAPPSLGRQLEARQRAGRTQSRVPEWSTHYSPPAHVPLTRRLRRAVAVWAEEPGLRSRLCPPFYGDVAFFYTVTASHRPAPPRSAPPRAAPPCAAPPRSAQRRLRLVCAVPPAQRVPLPRRLCRDACVAMPAPRRLTPRRRARHRLAWQLQLSHPAVRGSTDEQRTGYARGVAIVHPPNNLPPTMCPRTPRRHPPPTQRVRLGGRRPGARRLRGPGGRRGRVRGVAVPPNSEIANVGKFPSRSLLRDLGKSCLCFGYCG